MSETLNLSDVCVGVGLILVGMSVSKAKEVAHNNPGAHLQGAGTGPDTIAVVVHIAGFDLLASAMNTLAVGRMVRLLGARCHSEVESKDFAEVDIENTVAEAGIVGWDDSTVVAHALADIVVVVAVANRMIVFRAR